MATIERYAFGEFILEASERRLSRLGQAVALTPKAQDVLVALVRNAGRLVTKRELLELVWPESFVEEGILAVHISALRKALGDSDEGKQYIETVPRSGYRFISRLTSELKSLERPEIYELFGRGRSHLLANSMFEVPKAIAAFRSAIALDPCYAAAHAGLALAHCAEAKLRLVPPADAYRDGRAAALRALAMDDSSADAQVALGTVLYFSDWNWAGAGKSLKRALQINPNHTEAYLTYGQVLETVNRLEDGLAMKMKALERDTFSPMVHLQLAMSYWNQRRYDDSIAWARRALELDPQHPRAREHIAGAYWKLRNFDAYFAESTKHAQSHGVPAEALKPLERAYAASGWHGLVQFFLERALAEPNAFPALQLTIFHAEAGELDAAFRHLDRAAEAHDPALVHLAIAPQWDSLRADPRFAQCLHKMNLKEPTS